MPDRPPASTRNWDKAPPQISEAYHRANNSMMRLRQLHQEAGKVIDEIYTVLSELHNAEAMGNCVPYDENGSTDDDATEGSRQPH